MDLGSVGGILGGAAGTALGGPWGGAAGAVLGGSFGAALGGAQNVANAAPSLYTSLPFAGGQANQWNQYTQDAQNRANQVQQQYTPYRQQLESQVGGIASGAQPGAAQSMLAASRNQNLSNYGTMMGSARGDISPALLQRQGGNQMMQANQQALMGITPMAMQERQNMMGLQSQMTGQDMSYEMAQQDLAMKYQAMGLSASEAMMQANAALQGQRTQVALGAAGLQHAMFGNILQAGAGALGSGMFSQGSPSGGSSDMMASGGYNLGGNYNFGGAQAPTQTSSDMMASGGYNFGGNYNFGGAQAPTQTSSYK